MRRLFKDASTVFAGNAASAAAAVAFTILAARFLGPANWGVVAAVGGLIEILFAFAELGLGASLFRFVSSRLAKGKNEEAKEILQNLLSARLIVGIFVGVTLVLLAPLIVPIVFKSQDLSLMFWAGTGILAWLRLDFQVVAAEAHSKWKLAAILISLTNILRVFAFLGLFALGAITLRNVLAVFVLAPLAAWTLSLFWQRVSLGVGRNWKKIFKEVFSFSLWMSVQRIAASVGSRIDVLLLISIAGAFQAGIYAAAARLAMGVPLVIGSFATVLAPSFSSLEGKKLLNYFKQSIAISSLFAAGLVFGIFISPFITSLFGPEYAESKLVLQLLLASYIPFALSTPAVNILIYSLKRPQIISWLSIIGLPVAIFINILFIPKIGVFAPILALALINSMTFVVSYFWALRLLR